MYYLYDLCLVLELFVVEWLVWLGFDVEVVKWEWLFWELLLVIKVSVKFDVVELVWVDENFYFNLVKVLGNLFFMELLEDINEWLYFVCMVVIMSVYCV